MTSQIWGFFHQKYAIWSGFLPKKTERDTGGWLIPVVEIPCIYLVPYIGQFIGIAVRHDAVAFIRKFFEIFQHPGAEELLFFQGGFINDNRGSFCLETFHNALDGALAEIIGIGFHGQAEDAYGNFSAPCCVGILDSVFIESRFFQDTFRNEILTGAVGFHDCFYNVFRDVLVVGEELFGVLGKAVAAVTEGRVVVMAADSGVEAYSKNDLVGVESMDLRIGIKLVKETDAQG